MSLIPVPYKVREIDPGIPPRLHLTAERLAQQYPHYGYRRIRIILAREGHEMSWEKAHCLWRLAGRKFRRSGHAGA